MSTSLASISLSPCCGIFLRRTHGLEQRASNGHSQGLMLMEVPCNPHAPGVSVFGRCLPLACEAHPSRFCLSELAALWGRERSVTVVYSEQDVVLRAAPIGQRSVMSPMPDRKSTRLNSSHVAISYAVFCLKKKIADVSGRAVHQIAL